MDLDALKELPDSARVWVFSSSRALEGEARDTIRRRLAHFLPSWKSHEQPVSGGFAIVWDHFVIVAAHAPGGLSGCSIDSLVANFKTLESELGAELLAGNLIFYRDAGGELQSADHRLFSELVEKGRVDSATPVVDTLVKELGQLRSGLFEKPFADSWHARVFAAPEAAAT